MIDRSGAKWLPDHNVVLIKLVWTKEGTEEQRLAELRKLLSDNGIEVSFTNDDDDDDSDDSVRVMMKWIEYCIVYLIITY